MYQKNPLKHSLKVYFIILKFYEFSKNDSVHYLWCQPSYLSLFKGCK